MSVNQNKCYDIELKCLGGGFISRAGAWVCLFSEQMKINLSLDLFEARTGAHIHIIWFIKEVLILWSTISNTNSNDTRKFLTNKPQRGNSIHEIRKCFSACIPHEWVSDARIWSKIIGPPVVHSIYCYIFYTGHVLYLWARNHIIMSPFYLFANSILNLWPHKSEWNEKRFSDACKSKCKHFQCWMMRTYDKECLQLLSQIWPRIFMRRFFTSFQVNKRRWRRRKRNRRGIGVKTFKFCANHTFNDFVCCCFVLFSILFDCYGWK